MILHHYPISPYSEMVRLMLGHTKIDWQSAISPPYPPRAIVDPLVGGYRRIPVAQIGADLFCDTRIICDEIAKLADMPELSFDSVSDEVEEFASQTNGDDFMAVVQTNEPKSILKMLLTRYWPWQIVKLIKDRAGVAKSSNGRRQKSDEMLNRMQTLKQTIDTKTNSGKYLFGDKPTIADFAAYHVVWFADLTRSKKFLKDYSSATAWQEKMKNIGHGDVNEISKKLVFEQAMVEPRSLDKELLGHQDIGKQVTIAPTDYAQDSIEGELVGADNNRWIIARHTDDFGTLHVHFPHYGYALSVCE